MENKPKILIGLPTMGSIHILLAVNILKWMADAMEKGDYGLSVYPTVSVQPVDNARNKIVEEFLKSDCTHLFFVDSDTVPPPSALRKLLLAEKEVISAVTPIIEFDEARKNDSNGFYRKMNVVGMNDKHVQEHSGIVPCKGAGGSCILIRREVFERVPRPWYRFHYQDDHGTPVMIGEDIQFTAHCLGLGIQPYADTSIVCKHEKSILW